MENAGQPNILFITSDQQHWRTLGRNLPGIQTPNLDRLANEGTLFRRAYCPNPTCTPTRASMITGLQPSRHGAWSLGTKLPEDVPTVGSLFSEAGYETSLIGKAHFQPLLVTEEFSSMESYPLMKDLDFWRDFHGPFYGFDYVEVARNHADESHVGQHYAIWMEEKGLNDWEKHFQNRWNQFSFGDTVNPPQKHRWTLPEEFHMNAWIADRTNARIDKAQQDGKPFFLWASFFDPHPPYLVPEPWNTLYDPAALDVPALDPEEVENMAPIVREALKENPDFSPWEETSHLSHGLHSHKHDREDLAKDIAVYYGMVSMMDKYIGRILDHLDATGQADNTLVVFTSDHGHYYGHHGLIAKGPFHYDDGIRVPFIARGPGCQRG
ncbi:MAG: sulfatase, partial [Chthoniobacterales bacterium]